jgi:hypothetical protein
MEWKLQKKVITDLMELLKPTGKLLLFEGSEEGSEELNNLRAVFGLTPIPVKWHNLFFKDSLLTDFINNQGYEIINVFLTRGIRPYFDKNLDWNTPFNKISINIEMKNLLNFNTKFSRLKLWVIKK